MEDKEEEITSYKLRVVARCKKEAYDVLTTHRNVLLSSN